MTEAIYKRKHLTGGLLKISEGESMVILAGGLAAGRHGTGEEAESLIICKLQGVEEGERKGRKREGGKDWACHGLLKP